jgi:hypothetical protein
VRIWVKAGNKPTSRHATLLPDGHPAIRRVARIIGVNVRTLQRRLAEFGLIYR